MVLRRNPTEATWVQVATIDLSEELTDSPVDLGGGYLAAFTVLDLIGSASAKINGSAVNLEAGQTRTGFDAESLTISTEGSTGGTMTLEIHGRF